jgi:hemolysin III
MKSPARYSLGEEIANAITHGLGLALSIAGLVILTVFASLRGGAWHVVSVSVYGATLVMLYAASTFYHALPQPRAKGVFRILDHSAIYMLIAGTYTPFTLVNLRGGWGWALFGTVWGLAVVGTLLEIFGRRRVKWLSLAFYLGMGWLVAIAARPLAQNMAPGGLMLIGLGGLAYCLGVVFYVWRRMPYHHAVWHLFVLAGSVLHFFSVLFYVIPA